MKLSELRYVIAVAKELHFAKAAKACHVSQPSLSVAVSKLERSLGVQIFERRTNNISVTDIGQKIIAEAKRVLEGVETITMLAKEGESQLNEPLKIGAILTVGSYLFPSLLPKLTESAPDMPLIIQENFTHILKTKLLSGELDVIIVAAPFAEKGVVTQKLYTEPFVVLLPKMHPLAIQKTIRPEQLRGENMLLLGKGHCFRDHVIQACPDCIGNDDLSRTIEGTSIETLRHMVASGVGITVLPSTATNIQYYQSTLCTRPLVAESVPQREVLLAWRVSFPRPKAIDALIQAMPYSRLTQYCIAPEVV